MLGGPIHCWFGEGTVEESLSTVVDGRDPALVDTQVIPLFTRFYTSQVFPGGCLGCLPSTVVAETSI